MTEQEFLNCADPAPMLHFLQGRVSERKLRLFACACCRRIWRLIPFGIGRYAVEAAERLADGQASEDLAKAHELTRTSERVAQCAREHSAALWAALHAVSTDINGQDTWTSAYLSAQEACAAAAGLKDRCPPWHLSSQEEAQAQCVLLRDLVGPLAFRTTLNDSIRLNSNVGSMAQAIYRDSSFDDLPILADALEDAGCAAEAILCHLRGPGPHARGCWVIDLLLAKE